MPSSYFNYIEYHSDFIRHAYDDPAVTAEEPHIWIARDPMGLSEIEKIKLSKKGFKFPMKMPLLMIKVLSSLLVLHQLMKNQLEYNNNYNKKEKERQNRSLFVVVF